MTKESSEKTVILHDIPEEVNEILNMDYSVYKKIRFKEIKGSIHNKRYIKEDSTTIRHISLILKAVRYGKSMFLKKDECIYIVYDKQTQKIRTNITFTHGYNKNIIELLDYLNKDFLWSPFDNHNKILVQFITKTGLEKIIQNKITNPTDLLKHYLKVNKLKGSPKLFLKCLNKRRYYELTKHELLKYGNNITNLDHLFHFYLQLNSETLLEEKTEENNQKLEILEDLIDQADMLDKKINLRWSLKRMIEVHSQFTKEIMSCEIMNLKDEKIDYDDLCDYVFNPPFNGKLLNTKKEVFAEGVEMNHCVYDGYWDKIENKEYVVYSVHYKNERFTLGCRLKTDKTTNKQYLKFSQLKHYKNDFFLLKDEKLKTMKNELQTIINGWLTENERKIEPKEISILETVDAFEF